jgi:protein O-mannosyl-transferase
MKAWHRYSLAASIIVALTILAYGDSVENEFVHDDNYQIVRNPLLRSDSAWYQLFTTDVWAYMAPGQRGVSNYYRPLQMLTYRWTAGIGDLRSSSFHRVNLAFHALASLAAFALFWQLTEQLPAALAATVLFVVHPIHSEAVVWIAALPELGCAVFFFASLRLFVMGQKRIQTLSKKERRARRPEGDRRLLAWSIVSFSIALLWKEMALTLPLLVGSYVYFLHTKEFSSSWLRLRRAFLSSLPYWSVVLVYLGWRFIVLGFISKEQHVWPLSPFEFLLNVVDLTAKYWWKLLWPTNLNAFYLFDPVISVVEPRLLIALLGLVGILLLMAHGWKDYPLAVFSALWIFVTLIPVLNIGGVGTNVFTERYLYIPSFGFCLLVSSAYGRWIAPFFPKHQVWVGTTILVLVTVPYTIQCERRNSDWKDDLTFYRKAVQTSPKSAAVQNFLSNALRERSHYLDESERCALRAIELGHAENPTNTREIATGYLNLANIYVLQRRFEAALQATETGLKSDSTVPGLRVVKGITLYSLGRLSEAEALLTQISRQSPNDEIVLHLLGVIALRERRLEVAVEYFTKALTIFPAYRDAHNNLAAAYAEQGRYQDALTHLQKAAQLNPNDPMAHTNVGIVLSKMGRIEEARTEFRRAQVLSPQDPTVRAHIESLGGTSAK